MENKNCQSEQPKVLYVKAVGYDAVDIKQLTEKLKPIGDELDVKFIVTNETITLMSAKELLKELYLLLKSVEQ